MNTKLEFKPKGRVTLSFFKSGKLTNSINKNNTILVDAKKIMASRLANINSSLIDSIKVYNAGLLLASKSLSSTDLVADQEIQYIALFSETDFSGTFDKVELHCDAIGGFARLTGFTPQDKPSDESLSITWKIKIL